MLNIRNYIVLNIFGSQPVFSIKPADKPIVLRELIGTIYQRVVLSE